MTRNQLLTLILIAGGHVTVLKSLYSSPMLDMVTTALFEFEYIKTIGFDPIITDKGREALQRACEAGHPVLD